MANMQQRTKQNENQGRETIKTTRGGSEIARGQGTGLVEMNGKKLNGEKRQHKTKQGKTCNC